MFDYCFEVECLHIYGKKTWQSTLYIGTNLIKFDHLSDKYGHNIKNKDPISNNEIYWNKVHHHVV